MAIENGGDCTHIYDEYGLCFECDEPDPRRMFRRELGACLPRSPIAGESVAASIARNIDPDTLPKLTE